MFLSSIGPLTHRHVHAHEQVFQQFGKREMGEYAIPDSCVGKVIILSAAREPVLHLSMC